ncbi:hypothetical protein KY386_02195 [Candidatus Parcubacteria bacterium]|nr:hypothetical protein [Candidatus Parcubacteria bacterium]
MSHSKPDDKKVDHAKLGKAVEEAVISNYVEFLGSTPRQIWTGLVRGLFFGLGGVLGATLGVTILLFILQQFGGLPVVGEFFRGIGEAIKQ